MLLCPVVGPLFFFVVHFFYLTIFRFQVELDDVVFSKERVRTQLRADEEREMNVIPLEEAVAVNDQKSLRAAMLNVLKERFGIHCRLFPWRLRRRIQSLLIMQLPF